MKFFRTLTAIALVSTAVVANPALAATTQADLDVLATVDPACAITTTPVDFGTVDPTQNTAFQATGAIHVTCTNGTPWSATAGDGVNPLPAGLTNIRSMEGQTAATPSYLKYSLFTDAAFTTEWKNATALSATGSGSQQDVNVYGQIPSGQTSIPPDSYKDTVTVTLQY